MFGPQLQKSHEDSASTGVMARAKVPEQQIFLCLWGETMWFVEEQPVEYLYLPDGRIIKVSNDTTDQNLFDLWIAESMN